MALNAPKAPWVVGREPSLEDAVEEFLNEATRQTPWLRARYERELSALSADLAGAGAPVPVTALSDGSVAAWLERLEPERRTVAAQALAALADYLLRWGWLPPAPVLSAAAQLEQG